MSSGLDWPYDGETMQNRRIPALLSALACAFALAACEPGETISGPARVIDGDSLEIGGISIRLFGVDAFERRQACTRNGGAWRCGEAAARRLEELVGSAPIVCTRKDIDRYGRSVARCLNGSSDLAAEIARAGLGLAYRQYSTDYIEEEAEAQASRRGAWAGDFAAPWDWRRQSSDDSAESSAVIASGSAAASADCRIKGNINRQGERIYHLPGSASYEATIIDSSQGERWFCSESEAAGAGWRASRAR